MVALPSEPVQTDVRRSQQQLLTVEQAAERLGTPVRFVRRLIAERRICFCKIGRYVRIAVVDLDQFIDVSRIEPPAARQYDVLQ